jgi:hypothetical protein
MKSAPFCRVALMVAMIERCSCILVKQDGYNFVRQPKQAQDQLTRQNEQQIATFQLYVILIIFAMIFLPPLMPLWIFLLVITSEFYYIVL